MSSVATGATVTLNCANGTADLTPRWSKLYVKATISDCITSCNFDINQKTPKVILETDFINRDPAVVSCYCDTNNIFNTTKFNVFQDNSFCSLPCSDSIGVCGGPPVNVNKSYQVSPVALYAIFFERPEVIQLTKLLTEKQSETILESTSTRRSGTETVTPMQIIVQTGGPSTQYIIIMVSVIAILVLVCIVIVVLYCMKKKELENQSTENTNVFRKHSVPVLEVGIDPHSNTVSAISADNEDFQQYEDLNYRLGINDISQRGQQKNLPSVYPTDDVNTPLEPAAIETLAMDKSQKKKNRVAADVSKFRYSAKIEVPSNNRKASMTSETPSFPQKLALKASDLYRNSHGSIFTDSSKDVVKSLRFKVDDPGVSIYTASSAEKEEEGQDYVKEEYETEESPRVHTRYFASRMQEKNEDEIAVILIKQKELEQETLELLQSQQRQRNKMLRK